MMAPLALEIKKSVLKKLVFTKSNFLSLVTFDFLADFAVVDRFSKLSPTLPPSALAVSLNIS